MLKDTLVVWSGEFGRTVYSQGTLTEENYGRDQSVFEWRVEASGRV
jgi:Protein of unknown function (DUF1501)